MATVTEPIFSAGERNDIKEDLYVRRNYLIAQLYTCQVIDSALTEKDDEALLALNVASSVIEMLRFRTDGPKALRIEETRQWRDRRDLMEKIEDLSKGKS